MAGTVVVNQVPIDIYDADGNPVLVAQEGNMFMVASRDPEQMEMLSKIYSEMKKMNAYLSVIVGETFDSDEVDEETL